MNYDQSEVVKLLQENSPIAVCNGTEISNMPYFEQCFLSWLTFNSLNASIEENLYEREDFDLSNYKTIAFSTHGEAELKSSFEKIIKSFSKENLKLVIVGNEVSYYKIKDMAEKLNIKLICFDYFVPMIEYSKMLKDLKGTGISASLSEVWEVYNLPEPFFDPIQKWG